MSSERFLKEMDRSQELSYKGSVVREGPIQTAVQGTLFSTYSTDQDVRWPLLGVAPGRTQQLPGAATSTGSDRNWKWYPCLV